MRHESGLKSLEVMPTSWHSKVDGHVDFYNGVTHAMRSMIDALVSGTLMSKTEDEA